MSIGQYARMDFVAVIYPGFGFTCSMVLFLLGAGQFWIYKNKGYRRAFDLGLFCFFSALFALNIAITHSRLFSDSFTWFYVVGLQFVLFATFYYYMKSLSYYILIPSWLRKFYMRSQIALGIISLVPVTVFLATGVDTYFNVGEPLVTGNFFVDSYTTRFGTPKLFPNLLLSVSSFINILATIVLMVRVHKGSRDGFIMVGFIMTIIALAEDHLMLPFTLRYYVPTLFFANMLEALRMCFLSTEEANQDKVKNAMRSDANLDGETYPNKTLSEERIQFLSGRLVKLMEESRLYENPNLKLEDISHEMGIPSYQLSQVIRFGLNKNFYDLVNTYRVQLVQDLLKDDKHSHENILDIAYQAGFNSKSSFNLAFKKVTGLTPSEFRKSEETNSTRPHS